MRNVLLCSSLLLATGAAAKPWQGIDPGTSKKSDVIAKFGEPSQVIPTEGRETLAYLEAKAIKGTKQAQFKVNTSTQVVERIDVFPGPVIEKQMIEETYGPACPTSSPPPKDPCYVKKVNDSFRTYFVYAKLGLAVFFKEDNKTVTSFAFTPPLAPVPKAKADQGQASSGSGGSGAAEQ